MMAEATLDVIAEQRELVLEAQRRTVGIMSEVRGHHQGIEDEPDGPCWWCWRCQEAAMLDGRHEPH